MNSQLAHSRLFVFWNEVCDNMLRATDEETAKGLLKVQFKILEKKQEKLFDRTTNSLGTSARKKRRISTRPCSIITTKSWRRRSA